MNCFTEFVLLCIRRQWVYTHEAFATFVSLNAERRPACVAELRCSSREEEMMRAYTMARQRSVQVYVEEQKALEQTAMSSDQVEAVSNRFSDKMTMEESTIRVCKNFLPRNLNGIGTIFGGDLLEWMEKAAVMCASKFTRNSNVVTIAMDQVFFKTAISVAHVLELAARVVYSRSHTLQVEVVVHAYIPEWVLGDGPGGGTRGASSAGASSAGASSAGAFSHKGYFTVLSMTEYGHKRPIGVGLDLKGNKEAQLAYLKAHHRFRFWNSKEMREQEALRHACLRSLPSFYSSTLPPWDVLARSDSEATGNRS
jgi:acyl-CoA hydrolase